MSGKILSLAEVAEHKDSKAGVWLVIHGNVYDVSKFLEEVCDEAIKVIKLPTHECSMFILASWWRRSLDGTSWQRCHRIF